MINSLLTIKSIFLIILGKFFDNFILNCCNCRESNKVDFERLKGLSLKY